MEGVNEFQPAFAHNSAYKIQYRDRSRLSKMILCRDVSTKPLVQDTSGPSVLLCKALNK